MLLPFLFLPMSLVGQTPFSRTGQVFVTLPNALAEFGVSPLYQVSDVSPLGSLPTGNLEAIGFRKTDNLLYGILQSDQHLYRMGQGASAQDLGPAGLDNSLAYLAGDVSPDGQFLYSVGSGADGKDVQLAKTDLESGGYTTHTVLLGGSKGHLADIAFDPYTGLLYGYDAANHCIATLNTGTGAVAAFPPIAFDNEVFGLYFDAFGDLYAVGSAVYGIVSAHFKISKTNGTATMLATGPPFSASDAASCPFSVGFKNAATPQTILPCSDLVFRYTLANGSGETLSGLDFEHPLPTGFHLSSVEQNMLGGTVDTLSIPGSILLQNLTLLPGIRSLQLRITVGDIPKGKYRNQATIQNLPDLYGTKAVSDNPARPGFGDSTDVHVNRFEEDSLSFAWFVCHGETLFLDATEYGSNVHWNTGATASQLAVTQGALYSLKAGSTCEEIVVSYDVTSASCPYTIAVSQIFVPDTSFACSEAILRFILRNDSGEPRFNLSLTDTLPAGFSFLGILKNPIGGGSQPGSSPNIITIGNITLKTGNDTLDILLQIGDIPPGRYRNRALLFDLPAVMGPIRLSDDPATVEFDSSTIHIKGALSDSLFLEGKICRNTEITLDASDLGKTFLWDDGSTNAKRLVEQPGQYHLVLFDGCEPADVFWNVTEGKTIQISPIGPFQIHQGEQTLLSPLLQNQGDSLGIAWHDPFGNSLSCLDCPDPMAAPLESVLYGLRVSNEECSDSISIGIEVDIARRIYAPNVFSPNDDGDNDFFFLQSPDFGILRAFQVFDRWGNLVFGSKGGAFDSASNRWNGRFKGNDLDEGVYLWQARAEFADGVVRVFSGDVTLLK